MNQTFAQAEEFVATLAAALTGEPNVLSRRGDSPALFRLAEQLAELAPFNALKDTMLRQPWGHMQMQAVPIWWVISQINAGKAADYIVEKASSDITANAYNVLAVTLVRGATINGPIELGHSMTLLKRTSVPPPAGYEDRDLHSLDHFLVEFGDEECAAIVTSYRLEPAYFAMGDEATGKSTFDWTQRMNAERSQREMEVRRALVLSTDGPIELAAQYFVSEDDSLFTEFRGLGSSASNSVRGPNVSVNPGVVLSNLERLRAFDPKERPILDSAIDRLANARSEHDPINANVDLGLALEIAVNSEASQTEIAYKLGIRAAWLLGQTVAERTAIAAAVSKIYKARSKAAHRGEVPPQGDGSNPGELVSQILARLLDRGRLPDWTDLTLGGGG